MKEFLNEHTVANSIKQARQIISSTFLIVEGDTDSRVYKNFFDKNSCQTQVAHNKVNAIKALKILQNENFQGVLAITDADFDNLEQTENITNLFKTDFHDLECLIFSSLALEKVLAEFGSEQKINKFGKDIREILFEIGSFIGYLRWISLSDELNLTFEGIEFGKFIDKNNLTFTLDLFVTTVKNKSQRLDINNAQITQQITNLSSQNHDKKQISCGKDLVEIISLALQKVLGTNDSKKVASEIIARDLRLAYEFEFFVSTNLYQNVKMWETENIPFQVFR
jgi:5S rRNA maturation endonuclease (ribonuclease M5)